MRINMIEFEMTCPQHGRYSVVVPAHDPWPRRCIHCYEPVSREEVRRFRIDNMPAHLGSESWIG